jgi:hypothetical protein
LGLEIALGCLLSTLASASAVRAAEPPDESLQRRGLRCVSRADFPVPAEARIIPLSGADFETGGQTPSGWAAGGSLSPQTLRKAAPTAAFRFARACW